jgi:tetratricopeptide (TPR) repeat protein
VKRQTVEERREELVSQAREALAGGQYTDAVRLLERCEAEGIATSEIRSLLEFALHEEAEHRNEALMRSRVERAQSMIAASAFDEAIAFLDAALKENDDKALRFLYDQALEGRESLSKHVEVELANAARLVREGKLAETIPLLEALPPAVRRSARVQTVEAALKDEQRQAIFRGIGRAYAEVESSLPVSEHSMRRVAAALGPSTLTASVSEAFRATMQASAGRAVAGLTERYKTAVAGGEKAGAGSLAREIEGVVAYAGPEAKSGWESLVGQSGKVKPLARSRR